MPMDAHDIESMIKAAIPDAEVTIRDLAGDGDHYAATVISESFRGKSRVQQHQIVYQSLKGQMGGVLHALALQTGVPADRGPRHPGRTAAGAPWRGTMHAARCFARSCRTSTAASPTPNCSSISSSSSRSRRSRTRCSATSRRWARCRSRCCFSRCGGCGSTPPGSPTGSIPKRRRSGCCCFSMMLGGLVLSTSIPKAFESRGLWFAIAYAAMQVGKTVFLWVSTPPTRTLARMNAVRITAWLSVSAVFWIAGGLAEGHSRLVLWAIALAIEYISPAVRFWIPKYGASSVADWVIEGGHMAERCALFVIIALGESIVVTGATFADLTWTAETVTAFAVGLLGAHRDVVDLFPQGRRSRLRADFEIERAGTAGAARLYLSAHADRRRHHPLGGRRRTRADTSGGHSDPRRC